MTDALIAPAATARYSAKREAIVAAATDVLNQRGVRGMTLALVAERVGLITTSVTYYFKKKDELAAACFVSGIGRLMALVAKARREPTASERLSRLIGLYLELRARIRAGVEPDIPIFSDIRALSPETQGAAGYAYGRLFRAVRALFAAPGGEHLRRGEATARTHILLEQIHWAESWLGRYEPGDYPAVAERMHDALTGGLVAPGAVWAPHALALGGEAAPTGRDAFLHAATRLINRRGYRGASVELISAELNVTKGSFYHHHSAKDDVVVACFERSFGLVERAQDLAAAEPGDAWTKLTSAAAALVAFQFSPGGPLLRTTAFAALPEPIRAETIARCSHLSDRFVALIAEGAAEGVLRRADPFVAAQMLNATLNAAADLPALLRGVAAPVAVQLYARPFFEGLVSR
ncbi:MAG: TetR/AcrR family transcriptional regulator [Caulobacteraceae bacterium]